MQQKNKFKNEEIDILKIGLSGIAKRSGYQNVQEFYRTYHQCHIAYVAYREREAEWEKSMERKAISRIRKAYLNG